MALDEYTVSTNTGHVGQPTSDMSAAQLDDIERKAMAEVVSVKSEQGRIESAEKGAHAKGSAEGEIYGSLIADAVGLKTATTVAEAIETRWTDTKQTAGVTETPSAPSRHIDADIASAGRKPGVYKADAEAHVYSPKSISQQSAAKGPGLVERAGLTSASLHGEKGTGNLKTWSQAPFENTKLGGLGKHVKALEVENNISLGQKKTVERDIASKHTVDRVQAIRQEHSAMIYKASQMVPGLGLGQGPNINPAKLLKEARDYNEERT